MKDKVYTDQAALNIKLKKDKRNLVFGDLEGSISQSPNYDAKASTYYYTPTYSSNFIINTNTLGSEVLSYEDKQYLFSGKKNYVRGITASPSQIDDVFEFNPSFYKSNQRFATLFQNYNISKSSDIKLVALYDGRNTSNRSESSTEYFNVNNSIFENRTIENQNKQQPIYGQLDFTRNSSDNSYLNLRADFLYKNQHKDDLIDSSLPLFDQSKFNTTDMNRFIGHGEYYKKSKKGSVLSISSDFLLRFLKNDLKINTTNLDFISRTFNVGSLDNGVSQAFDIDRNKLQVDASYTIPTSSNADIALGYSMNTKSVGLMQSITQPINGVSNANTFNIANQIANLSYLKNLRNGQLQISLGAQHTSFHKNGETLQRLILVPKLNFKTEIPKLGDLTLEYKRTIDNPQDEVLSPVPQILGVDEVRIGSNANFIINNHDFFVRLYKSYFEQGSRFSINFRYTLPYTVHATSAILDGLYTIRKDTLITGGNQNFLFYMTYGKFTRGLNVSTTLIYSNITNQTLLNDVATQRANDIVTARVDIRQIKKGKVRPSLTFQYQKTLSKISNTILDNNRFNIRSSVTVNIKNVAATGNFQPTWVFSENRETIYFNNVGFSIRYFRKKSPWEFSILGVNLTQNDASFSVLTNTRSISERVDFLFPRQIILRFGFKF